MICSKKILPFLALEDSEREKELIEEVAVAGSSVIAWMEIRRKPKTFLIRKMHLNFSHQARPQLCWNVGFYSLCHKTIKPLHSVVFLLFLPTCDRKGRQSNFKNLLSMISFFSQVKERQEEKKANIVSHF